jgi:hypothetical protein
VQFLSLSSTRTGPGNELISTNGQGRADIICTSNCGTDSTGGANGSQLTGLEIKLGSGFGASQFIGNLNFGEGAAAIQVSDQLGVTFNYVLGNAQNFLTLDAANNGVITDIKIFESGPLGSNCKIAISETSASQNA